MVSILDIIKHKEHVVEAKKILSYNRKRLYKLPKKFKYLKEALVPVVQQDLLDIIAYWLKRDCIGYGSNDMAYFLSTHNGTYAVRRKHTKGVTNRRLNYLCALGLLKKLDQVILYGYDQKERRFLRKNLISKVSINVLKYDKNQEKQPINTFQVFKYSSETLEQCNQRARRLLDANITPGNISYAQLALNGLEDIAKEIYLKDKSLVVLKKIADYEIMISCIDFLIEENGYTTKQEIYDNCILENNEIDKLFRNFKQQLWETRIYKAPSKEEMQQYNLKSKEWIIIKKS